MISDKTGTLANVKRHDYLAFGEEIYATQGTAPVLWFTNSLFALASFLQFQRAIHAVGQLVIHA